MLHSEQLENSLTAPLKTQQSEGLPGDLLQAGQQISNCFASLNTLMPKHEYMKNMQKR